MSATKFASPFVYASDKNNTVSICDVANGLHVTLVLDGPTALQLAAELQAKVATLPRVGTAADLGCEVL